MDGFDFGTTRTKVSYIDESGKPCIAVNHRGEHSTPSVVHVAENGNVLVGTDAVEQGYLEPERCVQNFKLQLGSTESLLRDGKLFTATDAAAACIAQVKKDLEKATGKEVTQCVATCPANFKDNAKQALIEAYERNDIKVLALIPEPTAAAICYQGAKTHDNGNILVFDWGGGTHDVSIVQAKGAQLTVLATEGVPKLGGNDLDACLLRRVLEEVETKFGKRPTPQTHPLFFQDLHARVTATKLSLNTRSEVPLVASIDGSQVIIKFTQTGFHADIDPLIDQSLQAMDQALKAAGLDIKQINQLLMVGGTCKLPYIQERVADHTGLVPKTDIDPEKAIASGAALACLGEMANRGETATFHGHVIPAPDLFVRDVTAHDVGCAVVDMHAPKRQLIHSVIIPKNTPIPCKKVDRFYLESEEQNQARVEILQGKARADRDDCLLIGELLLEDLPRESKATPRIQVEYIIDVNGMVTATATDLVSKKSQTVSVDYKKGVHPRSRPAAA